MVSELSPYVPDLDSTELTELTEIAPVLGAAVVRDDHRLFVDAFRNDEIPGVHSTGRK